MPVSTRWCSSWFAVANAPEGERGAAIDALLSRFAGWPVPIAAIIEATPADAVNRMDIRDRKPLARWGKGAVTLLGDAAHPMTFNLGQGACMAIEDAAVLGRLVGRTADTPAALRAYEGARLPRTSEMVKLSWRLGSLGRWDGRLSCAARDAVLSRMLRGFVLRRHHEHMAYDPATV